MQDYKGKGLIYPLHSNLTVAGVGALRQSYKNWPRLTSLVGFLTKMKTISGGFPARAHFVNIESNLFQGLRLTIRVRAEAEQYSFVSNVTLRKGMVTPSRICHTQSPGLSRLAKPNLTSSRNLIGDKSRDWAAPEHEKQM